MLVIVLTGAIGSGKSAVAAILAELGLPVVDADEVGRELVAPGSALLSKITERFGEGILLLDGALDRKALGRLVFSNQRAREELEALMHPAIGVEIAARIEHAKASGSEAIIIEVPLYARNPAAYPNDGVVVVEASAEVRIARLRHGRGMSREEALARMASQPLPEEIRPLANWVIDNSNSRADLRESVNSLLGSLGVGIR